MVKNLLDKKYNLLKPFKTNELVRLGRNMVGGYVVDLGMIEKTNTLITFGFGPEWSFELDFLKMKNNCNVFIYDHNLSSTPYFKEIWKYLRRFLTLRVPYKVLKIRLDAYKNYKNFFKSSNVKLYTEKIAFPIKHKNETDLKKALTRIKNNSKVFLKIDIQCNEYEIIDQIVENFQQINMLVIVFYWINKNEEKFIHSIQKLRSKYKIIHVHANNFHDKLENGLPKMLEITLLNKKFIPESSEYVNDFPIDDLDYPCNPIREDISFSFRE
jgi:hypothetical protein